MELLYIALALMSVLSQCVGTIGQSIVSLPSCETPGSKSITINVPPLGVIPLPLTCTFPYECVEKNPVPVIAWCDGADGSLNQFKGLCKQLAAKICELLAALTTSSTSTSTSSTSTTTITTTPPPSVGAFDPLCIKVGALAISQICGPKEYVCTPGSNKEVNLPAITSWCKQDSKGLNEFCTSVAGPVCQLLSVINDIIPTTSTAMTTPSTAMTTPSTAMTTPSTTTVSQSGGAFDPLCIKVGEVTISKICGLSYNCNMKGKQLVATIPWCKQESLEQLNGICKSVAGPVCDLLSVINNIIQTTPSTAMPTTSTTKTSTSTSTNAPDSTTDTTTEPAETSPKTTSTTAEPEESTTTTATTTTPEPPLTTEPPTTCSRGQRFPVSSSCRHFQACVLRRRVTRRCPLRTRFDESLRACRRNVNCGDRPN